MAGKDVTLSPWVLQVDPLRSQVLGLEQIIGQLQQENRRLRAENQQLKDRISHLKRDSSNSSKPPSCRVSGMLPQRGGSTRLIDSDSFHAYIVPAVNAATCLAEAKAPP